MADNPPPKLKVQTKDFGIQTVEYKNLDAKLLMHKMCNLIGDSGSGKSVLLNGVLNAVKGHIPLLFVFSATAATDKGSDLSMLTPMSCIYTKWDLKVVKKIMDFNEIRKTNKALSYDLHILNNIFRKTKHILSTTSEYGNYVKMINNQLKLLKDKKISSEMKELINTKIVNLYRKLINKKYSYIMKKLSLLKNFTDEEKLALQYMNKNIEIGLIFNDFGNEQASMKKKSEDSTTFNNLYTRGRHFHITSFNLIQNKSQSNDIILSNAHLTFFTDVGAANGFFRRKCFSIELQRRFNQISEGILLQPEFTSKYFKVMYDKTNKNNEISAVRSDTIKPFRFTHPNFWKALKNKEKDVKEMISPDNAFKHKLKAG